MRNPSPMSESFDYETNFDSPKRDGLTDKFRQKLSAVGKREQSSHQNKVSEPDLVNLTARSQVSYTRKILSSEMIFFFSRNMLMIYVGYRIHITFLLNTKYQKLNEKDVKMNCVITNGYHLYYFSKHFASIFHILYGVHYHVVVELMFVILLMLQLIINQLIQQLKMINIKLN